MSKPASHMRSYSISSLIPLLGTLVTLWGCSARNEPIRVQGQLDKLPDGKMILQTRDFKTGKPTIIDTVDTRQGAFTFLVDRKAYPEPVGIELIHYQPATKTKRLISYLTNLGRNGNKHYQNTLILEDGIQISGTLKEQKRPSLSDGDAIILAQVNKPITTGKQTQVMYNDTADFRGIVNVAQAKALIQQHPYSYYYLAILGQRAQYLTNAVFKELFACFDEDLQNSRSGQEALTYVNERDNKKLTFTTTLPDEQGQARPVLNKNARYNLVVLWASWCGPCRQEIPALKQLHKQFGDGQQLQLVSISIDEKRDAWQKALSQEKMPWPQLLMTSDVERYAGEIFQYDHAVPLMLLVDRQAKVVRRVEGYDEKSVSAIEALVAAR